MSGAGTVKTRMLWMLLAGLLSGFIGMTGAARAQAPAIEATTASGEKVKLFPDGRWEYVEQRKAEVQREQRRVADEKERSSQGGLFGIGRRVQEGDKDYNRGSLNPKMR